LFGSCDFSTFKLHVKSLHFHFLMRCLCAIDSIGVHGGSWLGRLEPAMLMSFGGGGGTAYASRAFAAHRRSQPEAVGAEENGQHGERLLRVVPCR